MVLCTHGKCPVSFVRLDVVPLPLWCCLIGDQRQQFEKKIAIVERACSRFRKLHCAARFLVRALSNWASTSAACMLHGQTKLSPERKRRRVKMELLWLERLDAGSKGPARFRAFVRSTTDRHALTVAHVHQEIAKEICRF